MVAMASLSHSSPTTPPCRNVYDLRYFFHLFHGFYLYITFVVNRLILPGYSFTVNKFKKLHCVPKETCEYVFDDTSTLNQNCPFTKQEVKVI